MSNIFDSCLRGPIRNIVLHDKNLTFVTHNSDWQAQKHIPFYPCTWQACKHSKQGLSAANLLWARWKTATLQLHKCLTRCTAQQISWDWGRRWTTANRSTFVGAILEYLQYTKSCESMKPSPNVIGNPMEMMDSQASMLLWDRKTMISWCLQRYSSLEFVEGILLWSQICMSGLCKLQIHTLSARRKLVVRALAFPPEVRHTGWVLAILTAYAHFLAVVDAMQQIACNPKQPFFRSCYIFRNKSLRWMLSIIEDFHI